MNYFIQRVSFSSCFLAFMGKKIAIMATKRKRPKPHKTSHLKNLETAEFENIKKDIL